MSSERLKVLRLCKKPEILNKMEHAMRQGTLEYDRCARIFSRVNRSVFFDVVLPAKGCISVDLREPGENRW